jgi:lipopolysaccharide export system protein LptA
MFQTSCKILILIFIVLSAHALPNDRLERIHITADTSKYNYKNGINEFSGNVKADQGSTHLTADRLVTKANQHKIQEIIAYGFKQRAHYWTKPKVTDPELHAEANVIKYYPQASNITLEQAVRVKQGENSFQGELIHYNSIDQTITVPKLDKSRALIIYNPNK